MAEIKNVQEIARQNNGSVVFEDDFKCSNVSLSRKEIAEEMFQEGLLHPSVAKKKRNARKERKKKFNRHNRKKRINTTRFRKDARMKKLHVVDDMSAYYYDLHMRTESSESKEDVVRAYCNELKELLGDLFKNLSDKVFSYFKKVCNFIVDLIPLGNISTWVRAIKSFLLNDHVHEDVEDLLYDFEEDIHTESSIQDFIGGLLSSHVVTALKQLILGMVSLNWIGKSSSKWITAIIGKSKRMTLLELFSSSLQHLGILYRFAEGLYRGENFNDLWLAENPCSEWISRAEYLLRVYEDDRLITGLPVEGFHDAREVMQEIEDLIYIAEGLKKDLSPYDLSVSRISNLKGQLEIVIGAMKIKYQRSRKTPMGIVLHGDPGIGKSFLLKVIYHAFFSAKGQTFNDDMVFTRPKTSDYWTGYNPVAKPVIYYSEVGSASAKRVETEGDQCLQEILSLVDSGPFSCDMAEVQMKGKVFACPELVAIDTNNPTMHVKKICYSPAAVLRRFLFIEVDVKTEYRKEGSTAIDPEKTSVLDNRLDAYNFKVYRCVPDANRGNSFQERVIQRTSSIDEFVQIIVRETQDFIRSQSEMDDGSLYNFVHKFGIEVSERDQFEEKGYLPDLQDIRTESGIHKNAIKKCKSVFSDGISWCGMVSRDIMSLGQDYAVSKMSQYKYEQQNFGVNIKSIFRDLTLMLWILTVLVYLPWYVHLLMFLSCLYVYHKGVKFWIQFAINFVHKDTFLIRSRRRERTVRHLKYLVGYDSYSPYEANVANYFVIGASFAAIGALIYKWKNDSRVRGFSESHFYVDTQYNEDLNDFENEVACQPSRRRIKNKTKHACWNVADIPVELPVHKGSPQELYHSVSGKILHAEFHTDGGKRQSRVFGIHSTLWLFNIHSLSGGSEGEIYIYPSILKDKTKPKIIPFTRNSWMRVTTDIGMINLPSMSRNKNILSHFGSSSLSYTNVEGVVLGDRVIGKREIGEFIVKDDLGDIVSNDTIIYHRHPEDYMCGTPFIGVVGKSSAILGIHFAGGRSSTTRAAIVVHRERLEIVKKILLERDPCINVFSEGKMLRTYEPIAKSPVRYEEMHEIQYFGKTEGPVMVNNRSNLRETILAPYLDDLFLKHFNFTRDEVFTSPVMRPIMRNGEYISPYNLAIRKMNKPIAVLDKKILSICINVYTERIVTMLHERGVHSLSPIPIDEAINGSSEDEFLRRINLNTSSGFGFELGKSHYLPVVHETKEEKVAEPNDELKALLLEIVEAYRNEESCNFVFKAQLKDEPREIKKVKKGKTRVFYMTSLENLIFSRAFLSPIYTLMVEHGDIFCTSVGIDMHRDADALYHLMNSFSKNIVEGDYGGFDVSNPLDISRATCTVFYNVAKAMGYNDEALLMLQGILSDSIYPLISMNLDLFVKPGMQPSGKYGTAEDNSGRGIMMLLYAWYSNPALSDKNFFDYVLPRDYGDDIIAAVKDEVAEDFNNLYYQGVVNNVYNMEFTSASKSSKMEKFVTPDTMSFLRRIFRKNTERDVIEARLNRNSIYKSLQWSIPSKVVTSIDQMISTMQSALRESYFWLERYRFEEFRLDLIRIVSSEFEMEEHELCVQLPTYDEIDISLYGENQVHL